MPTWTWYQNVSVLFRYKSRVAKCTRACNFNHINSSMTHVSTLMYARTLAHALTLRSLWKHSLYDNTPRTTRRSPTRRPVCWLFQVAEGRDNCRWSTEWSHWYWTQMSIGVVTPTVELIRSLAQMTSQSVRQLRWSLLTFLPSARRMLQQNNMIHCVETVLVVGYDGRFWMSVRFYTETYFTDEFMLS